ncbi:unnamed protein product [Urochloa humidicola]
MSFDIELILQAISQRFDAFEAKWETRFLSGGAAHHQQETTSELASPSQAPPTPAAAAEAAVSPAAPLDRADAELEVPLAALTPSTAVGAAEIVASAESLAVSRPQPGGAAHLESQSTTTQATTTYTALSSHVMVPTTAGMAEIPDIEPTDEIRSVVNFEPSDEIRSDGCLTPAVVAPTESVTVFPIAGCVAPASVVTSTNPDMPAGIAPAHACVAAVPASCLSSDEDDTTSTMPTRCSTDCLNHNFILLKTICAPPSSTHAPATPSTEDEATNNSSAGSFEYIQVQYISTSTLSNLFGVVSLPGLATRVPGVKQMFEGLITQQSVMLVPMFQHMVSKAPWPPPIQCVMHIEGAELRPIPWPSFGYSVVHCASCQHNKKDRDCVLCIF